MSTAPDTCGPAPSQRKSLTLWREPQRRQGMSVKDLRDVLRGELELPLGGYIKLAVQ